MRRAERVFEFVAGGSRVDIRSLKREFEIDPKRNMRDRNDPEHMINKCSRNGQTPLYVACKHGNFEMVRFLLSEGANPHLKS